jgi:hypothetical protein
MTDHSDCPVEEPIITDVLARAIHREMLSAKRKAYAFPTWFRHSDAGKCARYLWFEHTATTQSNPPDVSSAWVMWIGTMLHEELQRALPERFPGCKVEPSVRHGDLSSGHVDALVTLEDGTTICYELKTLGSFGFDKAVGWRRKNWALGIPQGPAASARLQGALNATAADADLLVIGAMGLESASKGFADKHGISEIGRTVAEWHYTKAEFGPWATQELARLQSIRHDLEHKIVPPRTAIGDELEQITLNPNLASPPWQCQYCGHFDNCRGA